MKISYLVLLSALFSSLQLQAQQVAKKDSTSLNRELTLEREYNPSIRDAAKINQLPEIKEPEAPKTQVSFANYTVPFEVKPEISLLKANPYFTDLAYSKKRGYLSAGVSTFVDINGDLGYQILNSNKDQLSLFGTHRSTNGNVTYLQDDEKQKMKINDNMLGLDYMHSFGKIRFNADFGYTYSAFNYYGWTIPDYRFSSEPAVLNIDKDLNQVNNMFTINAGISSNAENEFNYMFKLGYNSFQQKYAMEEGIKGPKENTFKIDWDVHKGFNTDMAIGLGGFLKNFSYTTNTPLTYGGFRSYANLLLNPYFTMEGDNWDMRLGANANFTGSDSKVRFAPDIAFTYRPLEKTALYLILTGGVKDNDLYSMFYENRYVSPLLKINNSATVFDGTLGFKTNVMGNISLDFFTGYKHVVNEHFFVPLIPYTGMITSTYLAGNMSYALLMDANVFKLGGNIKYAYQDLFELGLKATYYNWDVSSNKAWNKPTFESDLTVGAKIPQIPLHLEAIYHLEAGRKALMFFSSENMKNINELKIRGTYTINETFSVFGQANNLLFQKYDLWYGYPAQNFSFMGGLNIKF